MTETIYMGIIVDCGKVPPKTMTCNDTKHPKILALDPSGTGTTGIFIAQQEEFKVYDSLEWEQHLKYLVALVQVYKPTLVVYESTNYINCRGKDMTSLFKLIGGIESLPAHFSELKLAKVPVNQVKELKRKLFSQLKTIPNLAYSPGRGKGWSFKGQWINVHCLEAYLVFWLWKTKVKDYERR